MNLIRRVLGVISVILIILILLYMNYDDLSWAANKSNYLGLSACILNIWALIYIYKERKE